MRKHRWLWAVLGALTLITAAVAVPEALEIYSTVQSVAETRTNLSSDDSLDFASPVSVYRTRGNPTICVTPDFDTGGATATIEVALYGSDTGSFMGLALITTATAGTNWRVNGSDSLEDDNVLSCDSYGAPYYDVRVRDISTGTLDLTIWSSGANSEKAQ